MSEKITVDVEANIDPQLRAIIEHQKLLLVAKSFWYFGMCILAMALTIAVTAYIPYGIDKINDDTQAQIKALRTDLTNIVAQRTDQVVALADKRTGQAIASVNKTLKFADARTAQIVELTTQTESDLNARLSEMANIGQNAAVQIDMFRNDVHKTLDGVDKITANVNDIVAEDRPEVKGLLRDSRLASAEIARTSIYVRQQTPAFLADFHGITKNTDAVTADAAAITANIRRLTTPHWYDRLLGYGLNGAILYRQLNPATNLTVKGATILGGAK